MSREEEEFSTPGADLPFSSFMPKDVPTVNVSYIATVTGTSRTAVYRAIKNGKLQVWKDGNETLTTEAALSKWLGAEQASYIFDCAIFRTHFTHFTKAAMAHYVTPWVALHKDGVMESDISRRLHQAVALVRKWWEQDPTRDKSDIEAITNQAFAEVFDIESK